jgi:hypothetical protein
MPLDLPEEMVGLRPEAGLSHPTLAASANYFGKSNGA